MSKDARRSLTRKSGQISLLQVFKLELACERPSCHDTLLRKLNWVSAKSGEGHQQHGLPAALAQLKPPVTGISTPVNASRRGKFLAQRSSTSSHVNWLCYGGAYATICSSLNSLLRICSSGGRSTQRSLTYTGLRFGEKASLTNYPAALGK